MRQLLSIVLLSIWLFANGNLAQLVPADCTEALACSEATECCATATPEEAGCESNAENKENTCNDFACLMYCCMNIRHTDSLEMEAAPWKLHHSLSFVFTIERWKDVVPEVAAPPPWPGMVFS